MQVAGIGQSVECFQVGPIPGYFVLPMTRNITDLLQGSGLQNELAARNASYGTATLLFTSVSSQPWDAKGAGREQGRLKIITLAHQTYLPGCRLRDVTWIVL